MRLAVAALACTLLACASEVTVQRRVDPTPRRRPPVVAQPTVQPAPAPAPRPPPPPPVERHIAPKCLSGAPGCERLLELTLARDALMRLHASQVAEWRAALTVFMKAVTAPDDLPVAAIAVAPNDPASWRDPTSSQIVEVTLQVEYRRGERRVADAAAMGRSFADLQTLAVEQDKAWAAERKRIGFEVELPPSIAQQRKTSRLSLVLQGKTAFVSAPTDLVEEFVRDERPPQQAVASLVIDGAKKVAQQLDERVYPLLPAMEVLVPKAGSHGEDGWSVRETAAKTEKLNFTALVAPDLFCHGLRGEVRFLDRGAWLDRTYAIAPRAHGPAKPQEDWVNQLAMALLWPDATFTRQANNLIVDLTAHGHGAEERLKAALAGVPANGGTAAKTVCFVAGSTSKQIRLSVAGVDGLLAALGAPENQIAPVPYLHVVLDGSVLNLALADLGADLFDLLRNALAKGGALMLDMQPAPRLAQTRLTLTTVTGDHITVPARIEGGDPLSVAEHAVWRMGRIVVPYLGKLPMQRRLAERAAAGALALKQASVEWTYPTWSAHLPKPVTFDLLAVGDGNAWFAKTTAALQVVASAQRGESAHGGCDLMIELAGTETTAQIAARPDTPWSKVKRILTIDARTETVSFGYGQAPSCGAADSK